MLYESPHRILKLLKELEALEAQRKKFYVIRSELKSAKERLEDKKSLLQTYANESEFLIKQINQIHSELFDKKTDEKKISSLKLNLSERKNLLEELEKKEIGLQKISFLNENEIDKKVKFGEKISRMDICPVCKSKITKEHLGTMEHESKTEVSYLKKGIESSEKELSVISEKKAQLKKEIEEISAEISKRDGDLIKTLSIEEKKGQIKNLQEKINSIKSEISYLDSARKKFELHFDENSNIEEKYESARIEVQDISLRNRENVSSEISFKQREIERYKVLLKRLSSEEEELTQDLDSLKENFSDKERILEDKRKKEEELTKRFQNLISERDELQKKVREGESNVFEKQTEIQGIENQINNLGIDKARISAEIENLEIDMLEFPNVEIIKANRDSLINKLNEFKEAKEKIGSVNLLSLEVYDSVKKEYDSVKEKTEIIDREKESILKTINEIDNRKKKTFMKTMNDLNEIFTRNFSELSLKGIVSLELENKKEPFDGGVQIVVKTGHGKYFDVTSLSGGEQTLVALSLIFAIQEYKPYYFYVLDEVDAALDKRNSERLAELLKKHMKKGQYIVISHNDEVILNATNLYGVSMHEGISKVVSLKV